VTEMAPVAPGLYWRVIYERGPSEPIGIAGSGKLAQAIGRLLRERGEPVVCIAGRDPFRTRLAAEFIGDGVEPAGLAELPGRASRLLIAVSDSALHDVAEALAAGVSGTGLALHTCGAKDIEELAPLRLRGFSCGTLHPLQTICSPEQGVAALRGAAFAVSGDGPGVEWAERIVELLGGRTLRIRPEARPLYHAAAAMASNYVAALLDAAQSLLATAAGEDGDSALRALGPLVRTAVDNILERGPVAALTGPIERGDAGTVRLHLDALASVSPVIRDLYCAAGLQALDMARRKGLAAGAADRTEALLRRNGNR
jgi:predicted short-subunit dehydrogenase-like oxidoreductase (DUF2520 family)